MVLYVVNVVTTTGVQEKLPFPDDAPDANTRNLPVHILSFTIAEYR
jgi:hypothetical protein